MKHKHRSVMAGLLLCLPLWGAWAGPGAADMDRLLGMNAVDYATARNWVQDAAGREPGDLARAGRESEPVRLDEFAFLLARAFGLKGGIMYTLFPGPRYAYRELVYCGILEGRVDPAQTLSGERLLYVMGRALELWGEP